MAKVRLNRVAALMTAALATSTLSALAQGPNSVFDSGQPYLPGAMGTNIVDDTPAGPPPKEKKDKSDRSDSSDQQVQAAPAAPSPAGNSLGASPAPGMPSGGGSNDFTDDEKRMQKKYKSNIAYFKSLIVKGDDMMRKSPNPNSQVYKKGKIIKETGEKHLADIQTNNPFTLTNLEGADKKDDSDSEPAKKKGFGGFGLFKYFRNGGDPTTKTAASDTQPAAPDEQTAQSSSQPSAAPAQ